MVVPLQEEARQQGGAEHVIESVSSTTRTSLMSGYDLFPSSRLVFMSIVLLPLHGDRHLIRTLGMFIVVAALHPLHLQISAYISARVGVELPRESFRASTSLTWAAS